MNGFGVALGGGGAKGSYEIGVWKALRELEIPISCVVGTSVGALNGAMMVQGDLDIACDLWTTISMEKVIEFEKGIVEASEKRKRFSSMLDFAKNTIASGGLDITPLENLLHDVIDEEKIRKSSVNFGLVTFSLTDLKPVKLFKKDIPEGKLVDYLIASACFPLFRKQEIDNKKFIDGGVYDNVPISLMIGKGMKNIIGVDVSGPGFTRKVNKGNPKIIYIKNSEDLGGVLSFNADRSIINMELGYLDTMKVFGKLGGSRYYLLPSDDLDVRELYFKNIGIDDFKNMYTFLGMDWSGKSSGANKIIIDKIMRTIQQYVSEKLNGSSVFPAMAEITAEQLGISRHHSYKLNELISAIMEEYNKIKNSNDFNEYIKNLKRLIMSRNQVEFDREIKMSIIEGKFLISYNPYINESDEKIKRFRRFVAMAFPKIAIANMFISLVLSRNPEIGDTSSMVGELEESSAPTLE